MNVPRLRFKDVGGLDFPEWVAQVLGNISDVRDGTHDSPKYHLQGYPFITSKNLLETGEINLENVSLISEADFISINKRSKVDSGDILFGMIGTIGNPVLVKTANFAIKNVALIKQKDKLQNIFLVQYLKSSAVLKQFDNVTVGNTQKFIALGKFRQLEIQLPSIKEQTKIANFLTAVDEKIAQLAQKGDLLARYKKGVMQQIFSQQLRFKDDDGQEFPEWEEKELGKVTDIIMGQSPDSKSYNDTAEGKPLIQGNADISNRKTSPRIWTSEPTKECKTNDIILTVRAPVGAVAKSYHNACIGRGVCAIRSNYKSIVDFIYQLLLWFEPTKWVSLEQGSTFTAVNSNDIKTLIIPVPCIEEQTKIANFLTALDEKISHNQTQLNALKQYKQGLLQQMFV